MKKFLFSTILFSTFFSSFLVANTINETSCNENEQVAYQYATFGLGPVIFIPQVGTGYRSHGVQHGWDTSLNLSSIILIHYINCTINYHYYFQNDIANPIYAGIGVNGGAIFANCTDVQVFTLSPNFVFGREFTSRRNKKTFLEANIAAPLWNAHKLRMKNRVDLPLVTVKYGFSF